MESELCVSRRFLKNRWWNSWKIYLIGGPFKKYFRSNVPNFEPPPSPCLLFNNKNDLLAFRLTPPNLDECTFWLILSVNQIFKQSCYGCCTLVKYRLTWSCWRFAFKQQPSAACLNDKNITHHHHRLQPIYLLMAGTSLMSSCVTPYSFCASHPSMLLERTNATLS